jgi:hypothetical protein
MGCTILVILSLISSRSYPVNVLFYCATVAIFSCMPCACQNVNFWSFIFSFLLSKSVSVTTGTIRLQQGPGILTKRYRKLFQKWRFSLFCGVSIFFCFCVEKFGKRPFSEVKIFSPLNRSYRVYTIKNFMLIQKCKLISVTKYHPKS